MKRASIPIGYRHGRLVVVQEVKAITRHFECHCDCGQTVTISLSALKHNQSCGCLRNEKSGARASASFKRHGEAMNRTPEYAAWQSMLNRCKPNSPKFHLYGARGITVCERWKESFETFLSDMGRRPGPGYSIDRINGDGNYEPGNVRWADIYTQNQNRRAPQRRTA